MNKQEKREYDREYRQRPEVKKRVKEYYKKNRKKILEKRKEGNKSLEEKAKKREYFKKYSQRPKVKIKRKKYEQKPEVKLKRKRYHQKNKEKIRERNRKYAKEYHQRPEIKEKARKYQSKKRKTDINFRISNYLRSRLLAVLNKYTKTGKIMSSRKYGINYKAIIEHLKPFPKNLSKYHVDHIKPLCSFDLEDPKEVKKAFAPENHQWLLAFKNLSKGGKILKSFKCHTCNTIIFTDKDTARCENCKSDYVLKNDRWLRENWITKSYGRFKK